MNRQENIIIKNGGLKTTDYIYLSGIAIGFSLSIIEKNRVIAILGGIITIILFAYFSFLIYMRMKDKNIKIEISDIGFRFFDNDSLIPWTRISEVEIKKGKADLFDILVDYIIITIETRDNIQTKSISLEELSCNKREVLEFSRMCIEKHFDKERNTFIG